MRVDPMDDPREIPNSYWAATAAPLIALPAFGGTQRADVAVIGGGFTGLSAALQLAEQGIDVLVLDAKEPGWGASGRNHGQVVAALKHEPHEIEQQYGVERGQRLIEAIGNAPDLVFDIIRRHEIACNATRNGILTAAHSPAVLERLEKRTEVWQKRGAPLSMLTYAEMSQRSGSEYYLGGNFDPRGGAVNPLGLARGLAAAVVRLGGRIMTDAMVQRVHKAGSGWTIDLANGTVQADRVIIGTNGYTGDFWPGLKKSFIPTRTPQLVSQPLPPELIGRILPGGETMSDLRYLMFGVRVHRDGRLHLGGGGGTSGAYRESVYDNMQRLCHQVFPFLGNIQWAYRWTGFMSMTPDSYPRLFELAPGVVSLLGYSGRGIGTAMLMGAEFARWVAGARAGDLILPKSEQEQLWYYPVKELLFETAVRYYGARDRMTHALAHRQHRRRS